MLKRHREHARQFVLGGERYKKEVKKQIRFLILVTIGFTIAFSWRQTIFDLFQAFVQSMFNVHSSTVSSILTSTVLTLVSVALVLITSYFLQERD